MTLPPPAARADDVGAVLRAWIAELAEEGVFVRGVAAEEIARFAQDLREGATWASLAGAVASAARAARGEPLRRRPGGGWDPGWSALAYADFKESLLTWGMRRYLMEALDAHDGHITHTAEAIGLLRPNLSRLLKRYGIGDV